MIPGLEGVSASLCWLIRGYNSGAKIQSHVDSVPKPWALPSSLLLLRRGTSELGWAFGHLRDVHTLRE